MNGRTMESRLSLPCHGNWVGRIF